jgi:hypothetical protein
MKSVMPLTKAGQPVGAARDRGDTVAGGKAFSGKRGTNAGTGPGDKIM